MGQKTNSKNVTFLIKNSILSLKNNPRKLQPFLLIIFIELLFLELLYFLPRTPLVNFFGPMIQRIWGASYLHYPNNFLFIDIAYSYVQAFLFVLVNCVLIGSAMIGISNDKLSFKESLKSALSRYVHLFVSGVMILGLFYILFQVYGFMLERAFKIRSSSGVYYLLKMLIINGKPYLNLLIGVFVTAILGFLLPEIVIKNKSVFSALGSNFKKLGFKGFFACFFIVLIPMMFFIPMIIIKSNSNFIIDSTWPGISFLITYLSVIVMGLIDAVIFTSITKFYLSRESYE